MTLRRHSTEGTQAAEIYADLCALIDKHSQRAEPIVLLAISANVVGKLIAMQPAGSDPQELMGLVLKNIEEGNQEAVAALRVPPGTTRQ